jgi:flagellar motor protein MotB
MELQLAHRIRPLLAGALALLVGASCVSRAKHEEVVSELRFYQLKYNDLEPYQGQLEAENERLKARLEIQGGGTPVDAAATKEIDERIERLAKIMAGLGAAPGDVTVLAVEGGYGLRFADGILFDSGSAALKPAGQSVLLQAATEIRAGSFSRVWVRGHTDSDPVTRSSTLANFPHGNLQLSAARAIEVAAFFAGDGGIPMDQLVVAGFGPSDPVVANSSTSNKAKNRRVEIFVIEDPN